MRFDRPARVLPNGDLEIDVGKSRLYLHCPLAYQEDADSRRQVAARFVAASDGLVKFAIGDYDRRRPLVIDPVFGFSTFLAGTGDDQITAVTTDSSENVYVAGYTSSTDFPVAGGSFANSPHGYLAKLDPTGHTLLFSTFFGGSGSASPSAIRIDSSGNIIMAGISDASFPHSGAINSPTCQINNSCYFLMSLQPDGSTLNYLGLIGGEIGIWQLGLSGQLAVDANGNAYLAGTTDHSSFQLTNGTLGTTVPGYPYDATFILKVDPAGNLLYSTSIPGNATPVPGQMTNTFFPNGISVDSNGQVTIAGSGGPGLPGTPGVLMGTFPSNPNTGNTTAGFILQLNSTATALNYATYVPGTDEIGGLAIDAAGDSYVTGRTNETDLPVTPNAYQSAMRSGRFCTCNAGFVARINPSGTSVLAASYLEGTPTSGNGGTSFTAIALDSNSNVFVGGMTASPDFPLQNPYVPQIETSITSYDLILAELNSNLTSLLFGSFLNATSISYGGSQFAGLTLDPQGDLVVIGETFSPGFPMTAASFEPVLPTPTNSGTTWPHGFVSKLDMNVPAPSVCFASWSISFGSVLANTTTQKVVNLTNCGNAPLQISSLTSSSPLVAATQSCGAIAPGAICPIQLTFTPATSSAISGSITLSGNAAISPQISFSGQGVAPQLTPQPSNLPFGSLLVGTTGAGVSMFVQNTGNAALSITTLSISGDFSILSSSCTSATLAPERVCVIVLAFAPTAAGSRSGSLIISSNDPQNPQTTISLSGIGLTSYPVPTVSSLGSPVAQVGNSSVTIQVFGSNFFPSSVVTVNGATQQTTFANNTQLTATVNPSLLGSIGELPVTVFNPAPAGGESNAIPLTLYNLLPMNPSSLVYVPTTQLLYTSEPASGSLNPNTVVPINPATGTPGTPIPVCEDPRMLTASDDGSYLYVSCIANSTIERINLQSATVERTFSFPANQTFVADMHTVPGVPQSLVAAFDSVVALYNDSGLVNSVPTSYPPLTLSSFAFVGASNIYGLPLVAGQPLFFTVLTLNTQGLQFTRVPAGPGTGSGALVISDGTLLYTNAGEVWNPNTERMTGTFPVTTYNSTSYPNMFNTVVDNTLSQIYVIGEQSYQVNSSAVVLSAYGKQSLALTGSLAFPQVTYPDVKSLVRWGTDGFAFIAAGPGKVDQELYIVRTSIAASQAANPVPVLQSVFPVTVAAGGPAFTLSLSGTGFAANAVVYWNGLPRETTTISSSMISASIFAGDISAAGTAQITVVNPQPGGGTSAAVNLNIVSSGAASFSANALTFPGQMIGTSSAAQVISVTNSGTTALSFSSISISGDFSQTNTCNAPLSAGSSCTISVAFAPAQPGARTGTLTVSDSGPSGQQVVSLTGTGNDIQIAGTGSSGTTASVTSGKAASYTLMISPLGGFNGTVSFGCSNLPAAASCAPNPSSATLSSTSVTVVLTVSTSQASSSTRGQGTRTFPRVSCVLTTALVCLAILCAVFSRTRIAKPARLAAMLVIVCAIGCSSGGGGAGNTTTPASLTPEGAYTINFTVSGGGVSRVLPLRLVVQ